MTRRDSDEYLRFGSRIRSGGVIRAIHKRLSEENLRRLAAQSKPTWKPLMDAIRALGDGTGDYEAKTERWFSAWMRARGADEVLRGLPNDVTMGIVQDIREQRRRFPETEWDAFREIRNEVRRLDPRRSRRSHVKPPPSRPLRDIPRWDDAFDLTSYPPTERAGTTTASPAPESLRTSATARTRASAAPREPAPSTAPIEDDDLVTLSDLIDEIQGNKIKNQRTLRLWGSPAIYKGVEKERRRRANGEPPNCSTLYGVIADAFDPATKKYGKARFASGFKRLAEVRLKADGVLDEALRLASTESGWNAEREKRAR